MNRVVKCEITSLTSGEFCRAAEARIGPGAGVAPRLYADALRNGRFLPETTGVRPDAVAAWHAHFRLSLPEVLRVDGEKNAYGTETLKSVLRLEDDLEVECVRIPMGPERNTLCISSQVGCRHACAFCETGGMGFLRDLSAAEIVSQVVVARAVLGWNIRNIVFMGMGEPLDNVENVIAALRVLNDDRGLGFGQQRLTVCTVGRPDGLHKLATLGWKRLDLSLSLNAATDELRDRLMPVNRRFPLAELQRALLEYPRRAGFVYAINYCLLPGINDSREDAAAVARFVAPLRALVNVIPYNPGTRAIAREPTDDECDRFLAWLRDENVPVRRRATRGRSVMGGCGQLGNVELRALKRRAAAASETPIA